METILDQSSVAGIINLDNLRMISKDDKGFISEIIVLFIEETRKALVEMNSLLLVGEFDRISAIAHKLKVAPMLFGAREFSQTLENVYASSLSIPNAILIRAYLSEADQQFLEISSLLLNMVPQTNIS